MRECNIEKGTYSRGKEWMLKSLFNCDTVFWLYN